MPDVQNQIGENESSQILLKGEKSRLEAKQKNYKPGSKNFLMTQNAIDAVNANLIGKRNQNDAFQIRLGLLEARKEAAQKTLGFDDYSDILPTEREFKKDLYKRSEKGEII